MRNVIVTEFISLDGVIEDPGGAEAFEHGGWTMPYWDDEIGKLKLDELFASDALLLGRVTYEGFAAAWPSQADEAGFADRMNNMPKYVASTTLTDPEWNNSTVIEGDVAEAVAKLKEEPGQDILIAGSAQLVQTLREHDLVDEYRLLVYPIVLGSGKRLFGDGGTVSLRPAETKTFDSGVVLVSYRRADDAK
jgi:dihydrofolate reductase